MSEWGCGGIFCPILHISPSGGSTLTTSAPKSDRIVAALGPAMKLDRSTTFNPENILSSAISSPYFCLNRGSRRVPSHFKTCQPKSAFTFPETSGRVSRGTPTLASLLYIVDIESFSCLKAQPSFADVLFEQFTRSRWKLRM